MTLGQIDNQHKHKEYFKFLPSVTETVVEENINKFFKHMFERQEIWYKRNILKQSAPWTTDPILANYKFTNVYRELDRSSQWLIRNVLSRTQDQTIEDILFKIIIYRFFNQPDTFEHPKYKVELQSWHTFDAQRMWEEAVTYRENVGNCFHVAYMQNMMFYPMPKEGWKDRGLLKDHAYIRYVFPKVHEMIPELKNRMKLAKHPKEVLDFIESKVPGVGTFLTYEYFLDFSYCAKYWRQKLWSFTPDHYCNVGPGASLGIRLLFPSLQTLKDQHQAMVWLRDISETELAKYGDFKYLHWDKAKKEYFVNNVWNLDLHTAAEFTLCEFSKRWKMEIGEGKQRSKFVPNENIWNL